MKILVLTNGQYMGKICSMTAWQVAGVTIALACYAIVKKASYCSYGNENWVGTKIRANDSSICS
jgi:hypothetical protein